MSEEERFEAELERLRAARSSWVELALVLREAKQRLAADQRRDQSAIFETWANRKLRYSEGMLRRYSVALDFLIRSDVLKGDTRPADAPAVLQERFSVLELAARIDKISEKDGADALAEVLSGKASVRSLSERLRAAGSAHVETSTIRRSRAAARRPDRSRDVEQVLNSAIEQIYGPDARLKRAVNKADYIKCHFVVEDRKGTIAGLTVINGQSRALRNIQDAVAGALFSAARFKEYYVVISEGEQFLSEVHQMIDYFDRISIGLIAVRGSEYFLHRRPRHAV